MTDAPSLAALETRARGGDPRAQYVLAAQLHAAGRPSDAEFWLKKAAEGREPDALYTLATRQCRSEDGIAAALPQLEAAAAGGSAQAMRLLAVLRAEGYAGPEDWANAARSVLELGARGDPQARREVAGLLLLADPDDRCAAALLEAAGAQDAIASALLIRRAALGRRFAGGENANRALERLAAARYPRLEALKAALAEASPTEEMPAEIDWGAAARMIASPPNPRIPPAEIVSSSPAARMHRNAFSPEILEYLIGHSGLRLAPSLMIDSRDGSVRRDEYRTSLTATLGPVDQDLVIVAVNRALAAIADLDRRQGEFLSVLRYAPGQEYRAHFDWLPPGPDFERGGQRIRTALLYLNEDYSGGETYFFAADLKVKGRPGDLLVFDSVTAAGAPDEASRHASLPVAGGVKWIASKWFRERPYRF